MKKIQYTCVTVIPSSVMTEPQLYVYFSSRRFRHLSFLVVRAFLLQIHCGWKIFYLNCNTHCVSHKLLQNRCSPNEPLGCCLIPRQQEQFPVIKRGALPRITFVEGGNKRYQPPAKSTFKHAGQKSKKVTQIFTMCFGAAH